MCKFNQLLFTNIDSATSNYTAILTCQSKNLTMVTACLINTLNCQSSMVTTETSCTPSSEGCWGLFGAKPVCESFLCCQRANTNQTHGSGSPLTLTKLEGNQASLSAPLPHHQSLCEASKTRITSPALKASSCSSMVTWSQRASA